MGYDKFKAGDWNAQCDVCGFSYKASKMKRRWDGLYVCEEDFEVKHPAFEQKLKASSPTVPWTRSNDGSEDA